MKAAVVFLALVAVASAQIAGGLTENVDDKQIAKYKELAKLPVLDKYSFHKDTCVLGWPINIFRMSKKEAFEECAADCDENTQCSSFDVCDLADEEISGGMQDIDFMRLRCVLKHTDHGIERSGFWMPTAACPKGCGYGKSRTNPCACDHYVKKPSVHGIE